MRAVRCVRLWISLLALSAAACDSEESLAPQMRAASSASGPSVNPPSGINAVAASFDQIRITWQDNSLNESGFEVHRSTTGPSATFALLASVTANITSYANSGLSPSSQYCYKVRAFRTLPSKTSYSAFSSTACASTLAPPVPAAPSGVTAAPYFGAAIAITWTDNATNETGFRAERAATVAGPWTAVSTQSPNVTSAYDSAVPGLEQLFCYRVFAFNSYGDSDPSSVACTALPAAPTNLSASVTGTAVDLTWIDHSAVEDGYEVQRNASVIATLPANATTFHDAGAILNSAYSYVVRATKDGGGSGMSNVVQVVIATTPPAAPSGTDARPEGSHGAYVDWRDNTTNEAGFRVERSIDGGASWIIAGAAGIDEVSFFDIGQPSEQQLCYRVTAFNSLGDSPASNMDCTTLPAAPSALVATSGGMMGEVNILTWADNSSVEDGYEVRRVFTYCDYVVCYSQFETIAFLEPNATSYGDSDVIPGNTYTYVVVAIKDGGHSDASNEATVYGQ